MMKFKKMTAFVLAFIMCFGSGFIVPANAEDVSGDALDAAEVVSSDGEEVETSADATENPPINMDEVTLKGAKTTSYICRNSKPSDAKKWGYYAGDYPCSDIVINVKSAHVFNCDSSSYYEEDDPYDDYEDDYDYYDYGDEASYDASSNASSEASSNASSEASAAPTKDTVLVTCSKKSISIEDYEIVNNVLTVKVHATKAVSGNLKVNICNKEFSVPVKTKCATLSTNHKIIGKKKSFTLSISGYKGNVEWISRHPSIAKVSKKGKVKGLKYGNAVIIAKTDIGYFGCAVAVCPAKLEIIVNRAKYMGNNWKYSQPKRAQTGFYDCSSLVWKAYLRGSNINFGSPYWPGNTWTESAWCKQKGLVKGSFSYSKLNKLKLMPGDIIFKSSNKKKKYATTYHVEMFCGYICSSVDSSGKYYLADTWGARNSGYGIYDGYIWARPIKY